MQARKEKASIKHKTEWFRTLPVREISPARGTKMLAFLVDFGPSLGKRFRL
jgi:hypothetical protein